MNAISPAEMAKRVADLMICDELNVLVQWWTEKLLQHFDHDAGDEKINMFANWAVGTLSPIDRRVANRFAYYLRLIMVAKCAANWDRANPDFGAYQNALHNDYHPAPELQMALDLAHIGNGDLRLPIKTSMRMQPGRVVVRHGYGAPETVLYPANDVEMMGRNKTCETGSTHFPR